MTATLVDGPPPAGTALGDWTRARRARRSRRRRGRTACCTSARARRSSSGGRSAGTRSPRTCAQRGLRVAWSAGPGEEALVAACDPQPGDRVTRGRLDLAQVWHLLAGADAARLPRHRRRAPGAHRLDADGHAVRPGLGDARRRRATSGARAASARCTVAPFPCRDQHLLFRREVGWVQLCERSTRECAAPRCMQAIGDGRGAGGVRRVPAPTRRTRRARFAGAPVERHERAARSACYRIRGIAGPGDVRRYNPRRFRRSPHAFPRPSYLRSFRFPNEIAILLALVFFIPLFEVPKNLLLVGVRVRRGSQSPSARAGGANCGGRWDGGTRCSWSGSRGGYVIGDVRRAAQERVACGQRHLALRARSRGC